MILIRLNGDKAVGVYRDISPDYKLKENEILVNDMPLIEVKENERAYIYYRNGSIEYEVKTID